jgi:hypothetical protein
MRARHCSRQRKQIHQIGQHWAGLGSGKQPVREHRLGERLYVIGDDVVASVKRRVRTTRPNQVQRGPG